jgi:SAM-dependent methyltransferase
MLIHRLRTFTEYGHHRERMASVHAQRRIFERALQPEHRGPFTVPGFSYPAGEKVDFQVDFAHAHGDEVNWREWLACPVSGLNNRLRAVVQLADSELGLLPYESVYITEQVTPLYSFLKRRFPSLVGSEFLGSKVSLGSADVHGIRNEDLTCLSFGDATFDVVLSFDCFEHMPHFPTGMREIGRVIKPGGRMMWSVPFRADRATNLHRATLDASNNVLHHETPEYHGDPVNAEGCLCFTHFGWQMLDQVKDAGFSDAYAIAYWSDTFGYLGVEQFAFVAIKS